MTIRRLSSLRDSFEKLSVSAAIISQPENIFYLCGHLPCSQAPHYLIITQDSAIGIAPKGDEAPPSCEGIASWMLYNDFLIAHRSQPEWKAAEQQLIDALREVKVLGKNLAVERMCISAALAENILVEKPLVYIDEVLARLRTRKDPQEIEIIKRNAKLTATGIEAACQALSEGCNELELYFHIWSVMCRALGKFFALDCDIVSGPRAACVGGKPTVRPIQKGEAVMLDIFPSIDGYRADITRNLIAGPANNHQKKLHGVLEEAIAAGQEVIKAGEIVSEVYREVVKPITKAGYDEFLFSHPAGHGIGVFLHDYPEIIPNGTDVLEENMVVTLEPGIYIPGEGGMRLEDDFLVTSTGCERISPLPLQLYECK